MEKLFIFYILLFPTVHCTDNSSIFFFFFFNNCSPHNDICKKYSRIFLSFRWCKLRVAMVPHTIILEPFSECILLGLVASWAATVLLRADYLTFFLFHTLTWSLADWIMLNIVQVK